MSGAKITREALVDARRRDVTPSRLAAELGVSRAALSLAQARFGVHLPQRRGRWRHDVSDRQLVLMEARGMSCAAIGREVGMVPAWVRRRLDQVPALVRQRILREAERELAGVASVPSVRSVNPFWTPARDAILLRLGGTHQGLREAAELLGKPYAACLARWHILRAA